MKKSEVEGLKLAGKYEVKKKIDSGAFGEVYAAKSLDSEQCVALKIERQDAKHQQLLFEAKLLRMLEGRGIPEMKGVILEGNYNIMVMQYLGPSLEKLFTYCGRKFTLKTVLMIAIQMLERIEHVQSCNFIHRDIKPENFWIDRHAAGKIYILDFGLSKRFRRAKTGEHIPYKEGKNLTGTARYASLNTHNGIEQSRRDDLESVGYVLLYFVLGKLPWQNLSMKSKKEKFDAIKAK